MDSILAHLQNLLRFENSVRKIVRIAVTLNRTITDQNPMMRQSQEVAQVRQKCERYPQGTGTPAGLIHYAAATTLNHRRTMVKFKTDKTEVRCETLENVANLLMDLGRVDYLPSDLKSRARLAALQLHGEMANVVLLEDVSGGICSQCGSVMEQTGKCFTCRTCGFNTGCS